LRAPGFELVDRCVRYRQSLESTASETPTLVAEIIKPFEGTTSIPISLSTVRGIAKNKVQFGSKTLLFWIKFKQVSRVRTIETWLSGR